MPRRKSKVIESYEDYWDRLPKIETSFNPRNELSKAGYGVISIKSMDDLKRIAQLWDGDMVFYGSYRGISYFIVIFPEKRIAVIYRSSGEERRGEYGSEY